MFGDNSPIRFPASSTFYVGHNTSQRPLGLSGRTAQYACYPIVPKAKTILCYGPKELSTLDRCRVRVIEDGHTILSLLVVVSLTPKSIYGLIKTACYPMRTGLVCPKLGQTRQTGLASLESDLVSAKVSKGEGSQRSLSGAIKAS